MVGSTPVLTSAHFCFAFLLVSTAVMLPVYVCCAVQKMAQLTKDTMDKKFGPTWHVCIGEGFGFEVTYQARNLIYLYYASKLGVLVFKC